MTTQKPWIITTREKRKEIRARWDNGERIKQIADGISLPIGCVRQALEAHGIDPRPRWAALNKRPKIEVAVQAGYSNKAIAARFQVVQHYVQRIRRALLTGGKV